MELSTLIEKYNCCEITKLEIQKTLGMSWRKLNKALKESDLKTRQELWNELDFEGDLRKTLIWKYRSFVRRCNGKGTSSCNYIGKEYMNVEHWVAFCNSQKKRAKELWIKYESSGRKLKYAISIDRLDNSKGYISGNLQLVTHGFNSWKDHITPIVVEHEGNSDCFMSCEEASRFYKIRGNAIGEVLLGKKYAPKGYIAKRTTKEDVLKNKPAETLVDYYEKYIA
jgi:hypothetical protein